MKIFDKDNHLIAVGDKLQLLVPGPTGPRRIEGCAQYLYDAPVGVTLQLSHPLNVVDPGRRCLVRREKGESLYVTLPGAFKANGDFLCGQSREGHDFYALKIS